MKLKVFDLTNFHKKSSLFRRGDMMAMKKLLFRKEKDGHLE